MNKKTALLDFNLIIPLLLLIIVSIVNLYSAATGLNGLSKIFYKQLLWYGIGFIFIGIFLYVDYRVLKKLSIILYILTVLLILMTLFRGRSAYGAQRWLSLGPVSFQPSELVKFSVILVLANYFEEYWSGQGYSLKDLIIPLIYVLIPAILIIKQPDLGTGVIVLMIGGAMILFSKVKLRTLSFFILVTLFIIPIGWHFMKPYQKDRLITFADPYKDPLGAGYHLLQSTIAVGSGQVFGVGYLKGTQSHLKFLPEAHTDFIFSVLAEEWGFVGSIIVIILFILIIVEGLNISRYAKDRFGMFLAFGITMSIFLQFFINIGMCTGILPVVGITLPFMSYGGTSLLIFMFQVGILLSIHLRKYRFEEV